MTHVHEDLGAYVLGSLAEDEVERVRAHLAGCEICAAEHAALAGLPALLDLAVVAGSTEDDPLPPAIEERLLDRFAADHPPKRRAKRWRPRLMLSAGGALAGAAVAAAVLILGFGFQRGSARPAAQYRLALSPVQGGPAAARAHAALRTVDGGTVVRLWVSNLPAQSGDVYEVLCESKGWSASAGTFRVDSQGDAYVILTTAAKRGDYDWIRVVRRSHGHAYPVLGGRLA
ncbi:zf-HC2 domain-containing protein [Candidatus Solirubrobacter pratensis]|uniref:zf-HC2 domain-containing protein n=1 Tax=Candidatus Solirubrobacter pratensis TaxID=1298857 RepID=UPI0004208BD4|nr:zf-HC2 domain-containing protein [Candidatus Solirubrobacter pratensis]